MREAQTEVLVVGAGPVGLWTALLLADAGIEVTLIDRETRTAARSYACGLHPHTLKLLSRVGLSEAVIAQGRRIPSVAFYGRETRRAELTFSKMGGEFPFLTILPQNSLENLLEERLVKAGVHVHWNHRFTSFIEEEEQLAATVEELAGTSTGYIVPHWETIVKNRSALRTQFLIGADGHGSLVRQVAGFDYEKLGDPEFFAAFEFESDQAGEDEVRVVMDDTTNVLWPLPNNRFRWTFQLRRHELASEFPEKERRAVRLSQPNVDERILQYVEKVCHERAPWFSAKAKSIAWCSEVAFERRLVKPFGKNRCWLAGDAAHQTGPVGIQSMNSGFSEAEMLVGLLKRILRESAPLSSLVSYHSEHQNRWATLMGQAGGLKPRPGTDPWVRDHCAKLLPCLPAVGENLTALANQLGLDLM
jgi:2-polyprenyl-6-methoxyphenol hydroxylase-like FAD-dependent oxidoreductase